jgi:hypothetical protein
VSDNASMLASIAASCAPSEERFKHGYGGC